MTKLATFGVVITVAYLLGIGFFAGIRWSDFFTLAPNEWGDFLAGIFGPLAIFWLILGFFQQGSELRHSVEALQLQAAELKNSVDQQQAMIKITQQQLELDREVREAETKLQNDRELPFFQLERADKPSGEVVSFSNTRIYHLLNLGEHASDVLVKSDDSKNSIYPFFIRNVPNKSHVEIGITADVSFFSPARIEVVGRGLNGKSRSQLFSLSDLGAVSLLSCNPPKA